MDTDLQVVIRWSQFEQLILKDIRCQLTDALRL